MRLILVVFLMIGLGHWPLVTKAQTIAPAESEKSVKPPSSIFLEFGSGDNHTSFGTLGLDFGLSSGHIITFNFSSQKIEEPATKEESTTRSFAASFIYDPYGDWAVTPSFERWGARSDLTSNSLLVDATRNLENWSFGFRPEFKSLIWTSANAPDEKKRTGALGLHLHADYFGLKNWTFYTRFGGLNYGNKRFNDFIYGYYVTDSAFAQSTGLVKSYFTLGVAYRLKKLLLGLSSQSTRYVVGNIESISGTLEAKYDLSKSWTIGINSTVYKTKENDTRSRSSALNLSYSW